MLINWNPYYPFFLIILRKQSQKKKIVLLVTYLLFPLVNYFFSYIIYIYKNIYIKNINYIFSVSALLPLPLHFFLSFSFSFFFPSSKVYLCPGILSICPYKSTLHFSLLCCALKRVSIINFVYHQRSPNNIISQKETHFKEEMGQRAHSHRFYWSDHVPKSCWHDVTMSWPTKDSINSPNGKQQSTSLEFCPIGHVI